MLADFAYIEAQASKAMTTKPSIKDAPLRIVAGFHLDDHEGHLKDAVEKHRSTVEAFHTDCALAQEACVARDIKPLAIVPSVTWGRICEATGLYRLSPDSRGVVHFHFAAFAGIKDHPAMSGADQVDWLAKNNWKAFLNRPVRFKA